MSKYRRGVWSFGLILAEQCAQKLLDTAGIVRDAIYIN